MVRELRGVVTRGGVIIRGTKEAVAFPRVCWSSLVVLVLFMLSLFSPRYLIEDFRSREVLSYICIVLVLVVSGGGGDGIVTVVAVVNGHRPYWAEVGTKRGVTRTTNARGYT